MDLYRRVPAAILAASIAIVGMALASQYIGGLEPCVLCYYQRYPWYAAIALMALALAGGTRIQGGFVALAAASFAVGVALAVYHVGVEHKIFAGPSSCGSATIDATSIEALRAQLTGKKIVRCDEVQWSFMGLSLAGLNLIASAAMAGYAAVAAARLLRGPA